MTEITAARNFSRGQKPKVSVTLENEAGEVRYVTAEDEWLIENGLEKGAVWPLEV